MMLTARIAISCPWTKENGEVMDRPFREEMAKRLCANLFSSRIDLI